MESDVSYEFPEFENYSEKSIQKSIDKNFLSQSLSVYNESIRDKTIAELAAENVILKAKLQANLAVLKDKKRIMRNDKRLEIFENKLMLSRKVFAFRVIFKLGKPNMDVMNRIYSFLKKITKDVIIKQFQVNDYVYIKVKHNVLLEEKVYNDEDGEFELIQIDPRYIFTHSK